MSIAKEDETRGLSPLPPSRPPGLCSLRGLHPRAAGPQWMRPAVGIQQRPRGLESKCTQACASGRDVWGHVLGVHACMHKGKAMEYTGWEYRCQLCNWDVYTCLPTRAWAQLSLMACLNV